MKLRKEYWNIADKAHKKLMKCLNTLTDAGESSDLPDVNESESRLRAAVRALEDYKCSLER